MLGKTVVNLDVKILKDQKLPAITICIPAQISLTKLSESPKYHGQFKQSLNVYKKLLNQSHSVNETTWALFKSNLWDIYFEIEYETIEKVTSFDEISELSISHYLIDFVKIKGKTHSYLNKSFIAQDNDHDNHYSIKETPIKSFVRHQYFQPYICFTYFSALQQYWNSFQSNSLIIFDIKNDFTQYFPAEEYRIAIHSANVLPRFSPIDYFSVKPNGRYLIKYFQLNVELVLGSFESNCAEYDISNEYGTIRMESDCRVYCIAEFIKEKYNSNLPLQFNSNIDDLIRREFWLSLKNISIDSKHNLDKEVLDICSTKCKPDCNTKQYLTEIKVYYINKQWQQYSTVLLQHSLTPDIIVRHSFEMSLM